MGFQGYAIFVYLLRKGHDPSQMGLQGTAGDVSRWSSRLKLARNFRGLQVDNYSEQTLLGYNAFFQIFLTHSALERYLPIVGLTDGKLMDALLPHNPHEAIKQFFALDRAGKLFDFLHSRLNPKLRTNLTACRAGTCGDVSCLTAAVRHIFAHGHLAANSHDIKPNQVARACKVISDFLLDFMECDFTRRITEYYPSIARDREKAESAADNGGSTTSAYIEIASQRLSSPNGPSARTGVPIASTETAQPSMGRSSRASPTDPGT